MDTGKNRLSLVCLVHEQERAILLYRTRAKTGEKPCALGRVEPRWKDLCFETGRIGHGQKQTEHGMFGTRTETGHAIIPDTGKNGREDLCSVTGQGLGWARRLCIDTGRNGHGRRRTELDIFPTRAKTGVEICARNGLRLVCWVHGQQGQCSYIGHGQKRLEDLCFDTGGNGHGSKKTALLIFLTRTGTGNAIIPDTGENEHGEKRTELGSFPIRSGMGLEICASRWAGTDTDESEQRSSFFPHGQIRDMYHNGHGQKQARRLVH
ncbi:hypothetical protein QAD02_002897 [Eretmocerus hayati]|uniref:Uncharacterized protein n=1 Tax=Eretmocerus hayati TaxID=131215 RepID=A0ACC2NL63_9HYME|nr:hypothetical protein QAD02_002897 [Eretmocerus hayati]